MEVRAFNGYEDYGRIVEWWLWHEFHPPLMEALPNIGLVVEDESGPVAAGWLYVTNSTLGHMEWLVVKPKLSLKTVAKALDLLISEVEVIARRTKVKYLFHYTTEKTGLERFLTRRHKYRVGDQGLVQLIKGL